MGQVAKLKKTWSVDPVLQIVQKILENYCPCLTLTFIFLRKVFVEWSTKQKRIQRGMVRTIYCLNGFLREQLLDSKAKTRGMMMMNCFCSMVDRRKAFSLISSQDYCQRSSPSRISDTPWAGFEPAQNLSSGLVEWSCAAVITTTPRRHKLSFIFRRFFENSCVTAATIGKFREKLLIL